MNAQMGNEVSIPTPQEMGRSWARFITVASAVTTVRGRYNESERLVELAQYAAESLVNNIEHEELQAAFAESLEHDLESRAVAVLNEEMNYIAEQYWPLVHESGIQIPEQTNDQDEQPYVPDSPYPQGGGLDDKTVDEIDIVASSIKSIINKLPKWAKKLIDALMEALKLTRGAI